MQKTGIEWADFVANPVKGVCPVGCPYCYARKFYQHYNTPPFDDPAIRYDAKAFDGIDKIKKPSRIFVGSTIDLFCDEVKDKWLEDIMEAMLTYPQHTFQLLTKRPKRMVEYINQFHWGDRQHILTGATITSQSDADRMIPVLLQIERGITFLSLEPLLGPIDLASPYNAKLYNRLTENKYEYDLPGINWCIIGGLSPTAVHKKEWVDDIIEQCKDAGVPLFLKDNLKYDHIIRQFPEGVK